MQAAEEAGDRDIAKAFRGALAELEAIAFK